MAGGIIRNGAIVLQRLHLGPTEFRETAFIQNLAASTWMIITLSCFLNTHLEGCDGNGREAACRADWRAISAPTVVIIIDFLFTVLRSKNVTRHNPKCRVDQMKVTSQTDYVEPKMAILMRLSNCKPDRWKIA